MLNKLSDFFWNIADWKTFLLGFILYMIFGGYIMPQGVRMFQEVSGKSDVQVMDLQFCYSPEKARSIIGDYGHEGRTLAVKFGLIADTVYPMAYTFYFIIILTWILKGLSAYGVRYKHVHLFPLLILLIDYCENINLANLFRTYPNFSDMQVYIASFFTSLKWSLVGVLAVLILCALIWLLQKKLSKAPVV